MGTYSQKSAQHGARMVFAMEFLGKTDTGLEHFCTISSKKVLDGKSTPLKSEHDLLTTGATATTSWVDAEKLTLSYQCLGHFVNLEANGTSVASPGVSTRLDCTDSHLLNQNSSNQLVMPGNIFGS